MERREGLGSKPGSPLLPVRPCPCPEPQFPHVTRGHSLHLAGGSGDRATVCEIPRAGLGIITSVRSALSETLRVPPQRT